MSAQLAFKDKIETAYKSVFGSYAQTDLKGWQIVAHWFGYRPKTPVISVLVGDVKVACASEDNTPQLFEAPVVVEVRTHMKDELAQDHTDVMAAVALIIYDGMATCAALNQAMAGAGFTAHRWAFESCGDSTEEKTRNSNLTGTIHFTPW